MAEPTNRLESLKSLRVANWDGAFANAFGTLVGGSYIVQLIQYFAATGRSDLWIGIFTSIGPLLGLLQIPGAIWGRANTHFKRFVSPGGYIWRLCYIPYVFVPFLNIPGELKILILLICTIIGSAAIQIVAPIYNDWLAELIPANSRGWYFSRRNMLSSVTAAVVSLAAAIMFDYLKGRDQMLMAFGITFGLGILFAALSQINFNRMVDIPRANPLKVSLKSSVAAMSAPFRDRTFRIVLVFYFFYIFSQSFPGNFFSAYALEDLGLSLTFLQITGIMMAVGNVLSIRFWGMLADKYGNKPVLFILSIFTAMTPLQWILCQPNQDLRNVIILGVGHTFGGIAWAGISVCQFNLVLATAKEDDRPNYIGGAMALQAVTAAIAPFLGAQFMMVFRPLQGAREAYILLFVITMALRFFALVWLARVKEPGSQSVRGTWRQLSRISPGGYKALRQMTGAKSEELRSQAIASAAHSNFSIAQSEVAKALYDPAPRVRREAASALAKLGGRQSVEALVGMLREHPDLVDEEVLQTLGSLKDQSALEHVTPFLRSPQASIRRAAAHALGGLGGAPAVLALRAAAAQSEDPDLRRAALQSLRVLGAKEAAPEISVALLDPAPSVRIAAAEAVVELQLAEEEIWRALRDSLDRYRDEAASEVAYALGSSGESEDFRRILTVAAYSGSPLTRRRALLGLARMVGVEAMVYRLFLHEEMSRDTAILSAMQGHLKRHAGLSRALNEYSSEQETTALRTLAATTPNDPWLSLLAEEGVPESFMVGACHYMATHDA